ncbi:hypothetical protein CLOP_g15065, partial [Closterium sp. NIES-67]
LSAGAVRAGAVRAGAVRSGAVRAGAVRAGAVRSGAVRAGEVDLLTEERRKKGDREGVQPKEVSGLTCLSASSSLMRTLALSRCCYISQSSSCFYFFPSPCTA